MSKLDLQIRGATVIDGTGRPARRANVGLLDGRIVSIDDDSHFAAGASLAADSFLAAGAQSAAGAPSASASASAGGESKQALDARETIDAGGLMLVPGFIDPHTHYDAQLGWDPQASPSNLHGVTTVIGGNCGFSIAPLAPNDGDYIRRMMSVVEGMSLDALERGLAWDWQGFGQWLDGLDGKIAVNAGFLVGHCALRRTVMGDRATESFATADETARMVELLRESIAAGGLGLSSSRSFTHRDGDGRPVASRAASEEELLTLCATLADYEGTSLEFITDGCLDGFNAAEVDLMTRMSLAAGRPLNWNVFTIDSLEKERYENQLRASRDAADRGARIVALTMPTLVGMTMSFLTYSPIHQLPGWREILSLPLAERMAELRKPELRARLLAGSRSPEAGVFARVADFPNFRIGETHSETNRGLTGRLVRDIAAERGEDPFDTLIEVVLADELRTVLWPEPPDNDDESWRMRVSAWESEHAMLGGSDAGAHLDRMCGAPYTTEFLGDCLRGRKLWTVERAVAAMTDVPARLFGLRDRGRIEVGGHADLVLFDPETVGAGEIHERADLPGGAARLFAESRGVERVFVGGEAIVLEGRATDALPGRILRSGRDTGSVGLR